MATLYELTSAYNDTLDMIYAAESEDEVTGLLDELGKIGESWADKATNYAKMLKELQSAANALKAEADRLTERKKRAENAIDWIKRNMLANMILLDAETVETPIGKWSKRKGTGAVEVLDESKIPAQYLIAQPPKVDKNAIKETFKKTGEIVPGTDMIFKDSLTFK